MKTKNKTEQEKESKKMNASNTNSQIPKGDGTVNSDQSDQNVPKGPNLFNIIAILFLVTFILNMFFAPNAQKSAEEISYSQFINLVENGHVSDAELSDKQVHIKIDNDADLNKVNTILSSEDSNNKKRAEAKADSKYVATLVDDPELVNRLTKNNVAISKTYSRTNSSPLMSFITLFIIPTIIMYLIYYFIIRSMTKKINNNVNSRGGFGNMFGARKSKAKEYNIEKSTGVKFADVAGQDEAKESLAEMVDFLHDPKKYQEIGAKQPRGALLVGPPGTGKTLLAKAVAGEAGVPFYSISGSEFVEMFVGMGASRVRELFEQAKKNAPCIIFIDEIDAIGKSRDNQLSQNDEREQTLNQLLAEMDGFEGDKGVIVLSATNRPEILDKALLRPGRFDRRIIVEKPDLPGREAILKVHAKKVKINADVNLHEIALATNGATGADLANMINEGALLAVKEGRKEVIQKDLMEAVEVVIAGKEKKDRIMIPKEREMVAYHEIGHALVSALQKDSQPVQKITIVPRTLGSLGYTMNMPEEERYLMTQSEIKAQITTLLGGRAAEMVQFGEVTTGASNDIERATKLARSMVTQYGMSDKFGPIELESVGSKYLGGRNVSNCSPQTEADVDEEVRKILDECQKEAIKLLEKNEVSLSKISKYLLVKENITGEEFMRLLKEENQQT